MPLIRHAFGVPPINYGVIALYALPFGEGGFAQQNRERWKTSSDLAHARPPINYGVIAPGNHLLQDPLRSATPRGEGIMPLIRQKSKIFATYELWYDCPRQSFIERPAALCSTPKGKVFCHPERSAAELKDP